jgi:carbon starvation protein
MNILFPIILGSILLAAGYFFYGVILSRLLRLRHDFKTPAHEFKDGLDFEPANKFYLLGQHLSAIAAAGPIVGPILAGMWFGWVPTFLWIIFGGIFIGGAHDMITIVASIRHQGKSVAEVIKANMSRRAFMLFLLFLWFSLIYIITAFTDITASTFVNGTRGASVASASMMYLMLALTMGIVLKMFRPSLLIATLIFCPIVFLCIYLGQFIPFNMPSLFGFDIHITWDIALIGYCFIAAVIPVWLLLQPRGYLGGFFLTFTAGLSFIGILIGGITRNLTIQCPAFIGWFNPGGFPMLPVLFITVACGACSGFHAIVSSGTTSKQISKETDSKLIGYGGMLLESFVAIIALSTVLILSSGQSQSLKDPGMIYANGIAVFLGSLGINKEFALNFALLAFATFVFDTLDVATRLGRYIFEELTGWRGRAAPYLAALITLALPAFFVTRKMVDAQGNSIPAWQYFWTIFGASNQLLAAVVLLGLSVWLFKNKMKYMVTLLPALFMMIVAVISLFFILKAFTLNTISITGLALLILAGMLTIEGIKIFFNGRASFMRK